MDRIEEEFSEIFDGVIEDIIDVVAYFADIEIKESAEKLNLKQNIAYIITDSLLNYDDCLKCYEKNKLGEK